jgi:hypothetical protein
LATIFIELKGKSALFKAKFSVAVFYESLLVGNIKMVLYQLRLLMIMWFSLGLIYTIKFKAINGKVNKLSAFQ